MNHHAELVASLKGFPLDPGVYVFKDASGQMVYVGKAKNLKQRTASYIQLMGRDIKTDTIFSQSSTVECIVTHSELDALLLEARLIQSHQPPCNVLLKTGQPFLYVFISAGSAKILPAISLVRNQKAKGTYFGPFMDKNAARKVYSFLVKTFRLKLCNKKIENGCLFFHLGQCAGACRQDFDKDAYLQRLDFARQALKQGHKKFLQQLKQEITQSNQELAFERSRELHRYLEAFEKVFYSLDQPTTDVNFIAGKHVWILSSDHQSLWVFTEHEAVLRVKRTFYLPIEQQVTLDELGEYFLSFYREYQPAATILTNIDFGDQIDVYQQFCQAWHNKEYPVSIQLPTEGHFMHVVRLATVQVAHEIKKQRSLARQLKLFLKLDLEPRTIDCFDISHKQGTHMVGSCVRFTDGKPDTANVRKFHIKTVHQIDDYASLREIVARRYKDASQLPDLIVIDGGKGQLNAVQDLFPQAAFVSLAKREETVFSKKLPEGRILDQKSYVGQMLIALRDYAHHFAITFHRSLDSINDE
jgi:excinuclease ABC subunit C